MIHKNTEKSLRPQQKSKITLIFRWLAVLPAAIGAWTGIVLLINFIRYLPSIYRPPDFILDIFRVAYPLYFFIYVGAMTAPTSQVIVAIFLATVSFIPCITSIFIVILGHPQIITNSPWLVMFQSLSGIIASIVAVLKLKEDLHK